MQKRIFHIALLAFVAMILIPVVPIMSAEKVIKLPAPQMDGGKPLMKALKERKSTREFSEKKLSDQVLSNLLWAGCGINRPETTGRTTPSPMNVQDMEIYVALEDGFYLYDAKSNELKLIVDKDLRADTGSQPFVAKAPVNLVYVSDYSKFEKFKELQDQWAGVDCGAIMQNVYLFCSSEDLVTVVRGSLDKDALAKKISLPDTKKIILAQTVGYPVE